MSVSHLSWSNGGFIIDLLNFCAVRATRMVRVTAVREAKQCVTAASFGSRLIFQTVKLRIIIIIVVGHINLQSRSHEVRGSKRDGSCG